MFLTCPISSMRPIGPWQIAMVQLPGKVLKVKKGSSLDSPVANRLQFPP